jgi:hypothetical protein
MTAKEKALFKFAWGVCGGAGAILHVVSAVSFAADAVDIDERQNLPRPNLRQLHSSMSPAQEVRSLRFDRANSQNRRNSLAG